LVVLFKKLAHWQEAPVLLGQVRGGTVLLPVLFEDYGSSIGKQHEQFLRPDEQLHIEAFTLFLVVILFWL
jgi:hypothetical protein